MFILGSHLLPFESDSKSSNLGPFVVQAFQAQLLNLPPIHPPNILAQVRPIVQEFHKKPTFLLMVQSHFQLGSFLILAQTPDLELMVDNENAPASATDIA